jgi:hypothetical protein
MSIALCSLALGAAYFTVAVMNPPLARTLGIGYVAVLVTCLVLHRIAGRK